VALVIGQKLYRFEPFSEEPTTSIPIPFPFGYKVEKTRKAGNGVII